MSVLDETTSRTIRAAVQDLPNPVTLLWYTSAIDTWYTRAERALLEEIARSSPRIELRVFADRWDAAREAQVGIRRTPAIVLVADKDCGIRFYGAPDGYELETFLGLVRAAGERRSGLGESDIARVRELRRPIHLEVLASPS
jgi:alkyl hydroperoxide reductase subunit AhpF